MTRPSVLLLVVLLCLGVAEARAQASGVLLGIRYEEPISRPLPYYAGSADSLARAPASESSQRADARRAMGGSAAASRRAR